MMTECNGDVDCLQRECKSFNERICIKQGDTFVGLKGAHDLLKVSEWISKLCTWCASITKWQGEGLVNRAEELVRCGNELSTCLFACHIQGSIGIIHFQIMRTHCYYIIICKQNTEIVQKCWTGEHIFTTDAVFSFTRSEHLCGSSIDTGGGPASTDSSTASK